MKKKESILLLLFHFIYFFTYQSNANKLKLIWKIKTPRMTIAK
jgi:hypothetical protein